MIKVTFSNGSGLLRQLPKTTLLIPRVDEFTAAALATSAVKTAFLKSQIKSESVYKVMHTGTPDKPVISPLGTPVFADLILKSPDKQIQLINVLASVSIQKTIVKTAVAGRKGTVKEDVTADDFAINLSGEVSTMVPDQYPYDEVRTLIDILESDTAIDIISEFVQMFDVTRAVVEKANFAQGRGTQNVQTFSIDLVSDDPEEFLITTENA